MKLLRQDFSQSICRKLLCLCLVPWTMQPIQNEVFFQKKEFAPNGANLFLLQLTSDMNGC